MGREQSEADRFDAGVRKILSVSRDELRRREERWQQERKKKKAARNREQATRKK